MVCIYCGSKTKVTNSRSQKRSNSIWRRRQCLDCMATHTTIEKFDYENSLSVIYDNGKLKPFSRDKLLFSVYDSLKHRKTAQDDSPAIVDTIISKVLNHNNGPSINIKDLQTTIVETLQKFDKASAVHYQAYYMPN